MRICVKKILAAEQRYDIPGNPAVAIGNSKKAGREVTTKLVVWPWNRKYDGTAHFSGANLALEAHVRENPGAWRSVDRCRL